MFGVIRNLIKGNKGDQSRGDKENHEMKKHIAAGVLLLEAAHIDNECSTEEMEHIVETLKNKFDLPDSCVQDLLDLAHADREQSVDLWEFSRYINNNFTLDLSAPKVQISAPTNFPIFDYTQHNILLTTPVHNSHPVSVDQRTSAEISDTFASSIAWHHLLVVPEKSFVQTYARTYDEFP